MPNKCLITEHILNMDFIPIIPLNESDMDKWNAIEVEEDLPAIALRNSVLFPGMVYPITVNRSKSVNALQEAQKTEKKLVVVLVQKDSSVDEPKRADFVELGTLVQIVKLITMPDDSTTAIVQGVRKLKVKAITQEQPFFKASVHLMKDGAIPKTQEFKALFAAMKDLMFEVIKNSVNMPEELTLVLKNIEHARFLISFIATNLQLSNAEKLNILGTNDIVEQSKILIEILKREAHFGELKKELTYKTRNEIEKQQKEYFLQQQLKNIKEELGDGSNEKEISELIRKAETKKWSAHIQEFFEKNRKKLERIHPSSPDYAVVMNHLQLMLDLPWDEVSVSDYTLKKVKRILNEDHYGMEKIKMRILEYMAVIQLKENLKSPILCFVGPPGIGKTSLAKSIARAIGRKYIRVSLGGVHDESEIRGHRKTYIGAMPGRIIQSIKKVNTSNPVLVLDEIDKIGSSAYAGDPSAALLEVLDPEQNNTFYDNYLEVEYDLSKIFFVATANDMSTIAAPLRDRMEIIQLSGYDVAEKVQIAIKHLIPKQMEIHGIEKIKLDWNTSIIEKMIKSYTLESGVRDLDRKIAAICRYKAMQFVELERQQTPALEHIDILKILGQEKYLKEEYQNNLPVGVMVGLAWTAMGGSILHVESAMYEGKGDLKVTGNVGKVMQESAEAAITILRYKAKEWKINEDLFRKYNFHIHVPEGATPKDGPSAGITIFCSLFSLLLNKRAKPFISMTGEITLRGEVLPVGGIKEKILAAKRSGIRQVFLPTPNKRDVSEINAVFIKGLKIEYVSDVFSLIQGVFNTKL